MRGRCPEHSQVEPRGERHMHVAQISGMSHWWRCFSSVAPTSGIPTTRLRIDVEAFVREQIELCWSLNQAVDSVSALQVEGKLQKALRLPS